MQKKFRKKALRCLISEAALDNELLYMDCMSTNAIKFKVLYYVTPFSE